MTSFLQILLRRPHVKCCLNGTYCTSPHRFRHLRNIGGDEVLYEMKTLYNALHGEERERKENRKPEIK